jgi:ApaG protein
VDGEGVIGEQPYLMQGTCYSYTSGVNLRTELGRMWGYFIMENGYTQQQFRVLIPAFDLMAPYKMN